MLHQKSGYDYWYSQYNPNAVKETLSGNITGRYNFKKKFTLANFQTIVADKHLEDEKCTLLFSNKKDSRHSSLLFRVYIFMRSIQKNNLIAKCAKMCQMCHPNHSLTVSWLTQHI